MKILILSASPKNENSLTLQVGLFLEKISQFSVKDEFTKCLIGNGKYTKEIGEKIKEADFIMFCSSLFHFSVHQQLMVFLNSMEEDIGKDIKGKPVTYFTTSAHLLDTEAHAYMEKRLKRMGAKYIRGLSLLDEDILNEERREETANWYHYVRAIALNQNEKIKDKECNIVLIDTTDGKNEKINKCIINTNNFYTKEEANVKVINLREYKITPCQACTVCYPKNQCVMKDDMDSLLDKAYIGTDAVIYFGELQDGLIGSIHKAWVDRHVKLGFKPTDDEIIFGYILDMSKSTTEDLYSFDLHEKALNNFNKNYHVGICDIDGDLQSYYQDIIKIYNYELYPQRNFYSRASYEIFKKIAWNIQRIAPLTYEYFKNDSGYKLPELNINIKYFEGYEEAKKTQKNRLIPYKMMLNSIKEDCSLKTKRRVNSRWNKKVKLQVYESKENFFTRLLKFLKIKK